MQEILVFCREGFETDCAHELKDLAESEGLSFEIEPLQSGGLLLLKVRPAATVEINEMFSVERLVFARQVIFHGRLVGNLDQTDRINPLMTLLKDCYQEAGIDRLFNDFVVTHPHTEGAKNLQNFCKSFSKPFANALKSRGYKQVYSRKNLPVVNVIFLNFEHVFIGLALPFVSSKHTAGIMRLKFPRGAPSRSVLKLEEAFNTFIPKDEFQYYFDPRFRATDLGAAPGGWTSLFVEKGILVHAVDRGAMDPELMKTGLVEHHEVDAFQFRPKKALDWLVCDMVEKPKLVTELICKWIEKEDCRFVICNLKLPMKKRYQQWRESKLYFQQRLGLNENQLRAKHLYHDRQEITLFIDLTEE